MKKIRVLVVGCGNMGSSHARSYHRLPGFELAGLVDANEGPRGRLSKELDDAPQFADFAKAMKATQPDAVCVCTWPDSHAKFVQAALKAGKHVFVEKPIATTVPQARKIVAMAKKSGRKVVVGYILRHHPAWVKFIELARSLGKPLVMRMNLNQQSSGKNWETHKALMKSMSPIVDCGVHYVDVMCQMTGAKPLRVGAIGAQLSKECKKYNYGQLQVVFQDGSVGWYEAGWGPMMSEEAFFVKDVAGPKGCVSIAKKTAAAGSADIDSHTQTNSLKLHSGKLDKSGKFVIPDKWIDTSDEPTHQDLCDREQAYFLKAITKNLDLTDHLNDAVNSLRIVLAADKSVRTGKTVKL